MEKIVKQMTFKNVKYIAREFDEKNPEHGTNCQCEECCFYGGVLTCNAPRKANEFCHKNSLTMKVYWEQK